MSKPQLWNEYKRLTNGRPRFGYRLATVNELVRAIAGLRIPEAPPIGRPPEIVPQRLFRVVKRQPPVLPPKREKLDYPSFDIPDLNAIKYYINFRARTTHKSDISPGGSQFPEITNRFKHAIRRRHVDPRDSTVSLNITLAYDKDRKVSYSSYVSRTYQMRDIADLYREIDQWIPATPASDVYLYITRIVIYIVRPLTGGCNTTGVDRSKPCGEYILALDKRVKNNDCFFNACKSILPYRPPNEYRREFGLPDNSMVPIGIANRILDKYASGPVKIHSVLDTTSGPYPPDCLHIQLRDSHYNRLIPRVQHQCDKCLKKYYNNHKCSQSVLQYAAKLRGSKRRFMLNKLKPEKKDKWYQIIHYDIETYRRETKINISGDEPDPLEHTPYIIQCIREVHNWETGNYVPERKTFTGDNCMFQFIAYLDSIIPDDKSVPLYLNAFNGARFDHYFLIKPLIQMGRKINKHIISQGSIISLEFTGENGQTFKAWDLSKHLMGSLKDLLESNKCKVSKGDFDHDKACRWEDMSDEMRTDCLTYLNADVSGLKELFDKFNAASFEKYRINLFNDISNSSMSYRIWTSYGAKFGIDLPNMEQEKFFREAIYGGRCYPSKKRFISSQYDDIINGKLSFDAIHDYLIDADVVSLYPAAMAKFEYPIGECFTCTPEDIENLNKPTEPTEPTEPPKPTEPGVMLEEEPEPDYDEPGVILEEPPEPEIEPIFAGVTHETMGIYHIKYMSNKKLLHGFPRRPKSKLERQGLQWDLVDSEGIYTSIDIESMRTRGYKIEYISGYYWKKSDYIFREYINGLFDAKARAAKGTPEYTTCKLLMNGLYGKQIQRPIYAETKMVSNPDQYWKFWATHEITDINEVELDHMGVDGKATLSTPVTRWFVSGESKSDDKLKSKITKPTHLGAFILSYSRKIMYGYIDEANPDRILEDDICYTDTDSLQMRQTAAHRIKRLGDKSLGGITDDLGDGVKIIRGIWVAPKLYMLEYIKISEYMSWVSGGCVGQCPRHYHFRGKGLANDKLTVTAFEKMDAGESMSSTRNFQMKKIHTKVTSTDHENNFEPFSIQHIHGNAALGILTKTVNTKSWSGRRFLPDDLGSLPHQTLQPAG